MKLPMIASAVLLLMAAPIEKPPQTVDVPRWSVYELALTASDAQRDPYLARDLVGVFSGPNGQSVVVNGFWDGDRAFRLRFTPTVEGTWTYMTVSGDAAMDGQMGSIRCTPPQPGVHGFVRGEAGETPQVAGWAFDDGAPAWALATQVVPLRGSVAACGADDCGAAGSMARDHFAESFRMRVVLGQCDAADGSGSRGTF